MTPTGFGFVIFMTVISLGGSNNITFGGCVPGKTSCSECYFTLKQSLLKRDDNVFSLSDTFYPPSSNPPEFVKITYTFENSQNESIWYWTDKSSYLYLPINTFQFLSLFFGKPETFFTGNVELTLDFECKVANEDSEHKEHFKLLTQRVSPVISLVSWTPNYDDLYLLESRTLQ